MPNAERIRTLWRTYAEKEKAIHARFLARYPRVISWLDSGLLLLVDDFLSHPLFSVILFLVLGVLGAAGIGWVIAVSVGVAWLVCFLWMARSKGIKRLTIVSRSVVLVGSGIALAVLFSFLGSWALKQHAAESTPKSPHLLVQNIGMLGMQIGQPLNVLLFLKNDGDADASLQFSVTVTFVDHLPNTPETREDTEAFLFSQAVHKLDDPNIPKELLELSPGEVYSNGIAGPIITPQLLQSNKVLYVTGLFRYVGRPGLKPVEFCAFWAAEHSFRKEDCQSHNRS